MKLIKMISIIMCILLATACSEVEEPKIIGESPAEWRGVFAMKGNIYTIDRGKVLIENVEEEIGEIQFIVEEVTKNGEAAIIDANLNLKSGAKVYKIKGIDRSNPVVAINIDNIYYGAIFHSKLNE